MLNIAHRGASGITPENTMLAFFTAISGGADLIEFDVQLTKDLQTVIFHDRDMKRITKSEKGIADFTMKQLKRKDVGKWKGKQFSKIRIPSFHEVMEQLPQSQSLLIEVKPQKRPIEKGRKLEEEILKIMDKTRSVSQGYISVRDEETYEWFKKNCDYPIGLMQKKKTPEKMLELAKHYNLEYSQIRGRTYNDTQLKELKKTKTKIITYYDDGNSLDAMEWRHLKEIGVDGVVTNFPSIFSAARLMNYQF